MSVLEAAKSHFKTIGDKEIEVPEWGVTIYAKPMNLKEKNLVYKKMQTDYLLAMAEILVLKACDKNWEKLFGRGDIADLTNKVDPDVLARVANEIIEADSIEDAEGN